jgi:acyl dehydratase
MSIVELPGEPGIGGLYGRAAIRMVPTRRPRHLPDTELVLRDVRVDRERLAAYDRVCGFRLGDSLPATYPHVLAFPLAMSLMTAADFPFPVVGLVHVANRIELLRPIDATEPIDLAVLATNLRGHDRGRQFDVVASASVDGVVVWRGISTYLRKESRGGGGGAAAEAPPTPSALWRVEPRIGVEYARVSGDRNPIHTSWLGARLFGFPGPIAHGMWSKARCLAAFAGRLPSAYTVDVVFKRPIALPSTIGFSSTPSGEFALHSSHPHLIGFINT